MGLTSAEDKLHSRGVRLLALAGDLRCEHFKSVSLGWG